MSLTAQAPRPATHVRHRPEQTLLYQLVERHYPEFARLMAAQGSPLPGYVAREFEDYLKCGRLEHGFLRVRCQSCHHEKLVAFSCKRRGFCPSCGVRRMVDSAALLVIDELHNVLAGNSVNRREFLNLLRFLGNELRIPLVGVGTRDAYLAIRSDDQLEHRVEPMMLPGWEANDDCCSLLAGNSVNRREFLNLLRFLGNELRIPLVGVGTRDAYLAIRSDDQLENRFEPMMLPVWEANDDCCSLLASFAASLPLRRSSTIATLDMARYLLTRSEGTIGELAHLLMAAAIAAVESGEEAINHRTLSMADYTGPSERRRQFERELM